MVRKNTSNAELCYKDTCARFSGENADIITAITSIVIVVVGLTLVSKIIK